MHLYDPDQLPPYEIKQRAVEYVRRRIADMLGRKKPMGYHAAAWFFQAKVLDPRGAVLVPKDGGRVVLERMQDTTYFLKAWDW